MYTHTTPYELFILGKKIQDMFRVNKFIFLHQMNLYPKIFRDPVLHSRHKNIYIQIQ